jgi:tRNA (cytidine56-2'-O)-methyltransferase
MTVSVLRLGHRIFRDQRITTHVFLTARAFGSKEGFYTGQHDTEMEQSIGRVCQDFGGSFSVSHRKSWKSFLEKWKKQKGHVAHLTVYGVPFEKRIRQIRNKRNLLVVVGGEKVPPGVYNMADWNVSVGSQPHSEVAALAVFLHEMRKGKLPAAFKNAKMKIIPQERGKKVLGK